LSPLRTLVLSFRLSRDLWKATAGRMKATVKRLKVCVHDMQLNRGSWRLWAEAAEEELAKLRAQVATPTESVSESPPKKKRRAMR
jgi:hypothetical protein